MRFATLLVVAASAGLVACSAELVSPAPIAGPPVTAMYDVAAESELSPYPSDRYTVADPETPTGLRVHIGKDTTGDPLAAVYSTTIDELNAMDGFSTVGGVAIGFDGPIDVTGIAPLPGVEPVDQPPLEDASFYTTKDSPLILVDVDPDSPERGKARGLVARYWAQPKNVDYSVADYTLVVQPAVPLLPATRYLFVVTRKLHGEGGGALGRSGESERLLSKPSADRYDAEVHEGLDELEKGVGVGVDDVVLATAFTTATIHDELVAMAGAARAAPVPALLEPWTVETPIEPEGHIRFRAVYETPEYRKPKPDGKWVIEGGKPVVQKKVGLELFLSFADGNMSGPRPVVIFAHGLGGDKDGSSGTAKRLAELGAAVFAIDSPEHGSRSEHPESPLFATFNFFGIDQETLTFDIGRARDNFRQMASDQLELVRFIDSLGSLDLLPAGAPDGVPDLDVSRILYIGHSFGSVQGPTIFALAPEITQAVWNVGGDGLTTLLRDSGTFSVLVNALKPAETTDGDVARFFVVGQAIVDPGDPLNFARFGTQLALPGVPGWKPRDALIQEVIDDNIVPNSTSEALARAAGLVLIDPIVPISGLPTAEAPVTGNLPSGATGAISQFDKIEGGVTATHGELIFSPEAQAQYVQFFASGLEAVHATVQPAY